MTDIILYNNEEKQVILRQNPLTKGITIMVWNKQSRKMTVYKNRKMIINLFAKYVNGGK